MIDYMHAEHVVDVDICEDGRGWEWKCSCGTASGPWLKHIADQQALRHKREWDAYQSRPQDLHCALCTRRLAVKSRVMLNGQGYHKKCLEKVIASA